MDYPTVTGSSHCIIEIFSTPDLIQIIKYFNVILFFLDVAFPSLSSQCFFVFFAWLFYKIDEAHYKLTNHFIHSFSQSIFKIILLGKSFLNIHFLKTITEPEKVMNFQLLKKNCIFRNVSFVLNYSYNDSRLVS